MCYIWNIEHLNTVKPSFSRTPIRLPATVFTGCQVSKNRYLTKNMCHGSDSNDQFWKKTNYLKILRNTRIFKCIVYFRPGGYFIAKETFEWHKTRQSYGHNCPSSRELTKQDTLRKTNITCRCAPQWFFHTVDKPLDNNNEICNCIDPLPYVPACRIRGSNTSEVEEIFYGNGCKCMQYLIASKYNKRENFSKWQ